VATCFSAMFLCGCRGGGLGRAESFSSMFTNGRASCRGLAERLSSMFRTGCRGGGRGLAMVHSSMFLCGRGSGRGGAKSYSSIFMGLAGGSCDLWLSSMSRGQVHSSM
jgi:hypothetical protein